MSPFDFDSTLKRSLFMFDHTFDLVWLHDQDPFDQVCLIVDLVVVNIFFFFSFSVSPPDGTTR